MLCAWKHMLLNAAWRSTKETAETLWVPQLVDTTLLGGHRPARGGGGGGGQYRKNNLM